MTTFEPCWEIVDNTLHARLDAGEVASQLSFECILDLSGLGDVVGVEVLDFSRQLEGATPPAAPSGDPFRWSYDTEIDAFYLHVAPANAPIQKKSSGLALLTDQRHLVGVQIKLPGLEP